MNTTLAIVWTLSLLANGFAAPVSYRENRPWRFWINVVAVLGSALGVYAAIGGFHP